MLYDAIVHVVHDQVRAYALGEKITRHIDQHFEAGKASEAVGQTLLYNDDFPSPIASFVQTQDNGRNKQPS